MPDLTGVDRIGGFSIINGSLWVLAVFSLPAMTAGIVAAQDEVEVTIKRNATARKDGQILRVHVKVACDPVGEVLEAFVEVLDREGIFGDGFRACRM